jgi:hypothetical protein
MTTHRKYTYEEVKEIAEQYTTLAEFTKNHVGAYEAALHNGWLSYFTNLKRKRIHTVESVLNECNKFNSYKEFINSDESVYNAFRKFYDNGKIKDEDLPWIVTKRKREWTYEDCYNEAKKYDSKWNFSLGCGSAYNAARKNKWLDEMPWLVLTPIKWTRDTVFEESHRYKSRGEFQKKGRGAYAVAQKNKWLDEMTWLKPQLKTWNKEKVIEEAMKYSTKVMFHNKSSVAYRVALRNKWMDEIAEIVGWK